MKHLINETFWKRLEKSSNANVVIQKHGNVYDVQRSDTHVQARILLPKELVLEHKAVHQLLDFASVQRQDSTSPVCQVCATPDVHPGSLVPVGSIVATDADVVIPAAIGTDINCGMRLIDTGLTQSGWQLHQEKIVQRLRAVLLEGQRSVPLHQQHFAHLFNGSAGEFIVHLKKTKEALLENAGIWSGVDFDRLELELDKTLGVLSLKGALEDAPSAYQNDKHAIFRDPDLGTAGSGNHFVEIQVVDKVLDRHAAYEARVKEGNVLVMIHSGARSFGFHVGVPWMDRAKAQWMKGVKHPEHGVYALEGLLAKEYLRAHATAARYAWLNRVVLAELVRKELAHFGAHGDMIVDVPHNVITQEKGLNVHRKGATAAHENQFALIPGSMGDYSYLVKGLGNAQWLDSCSHGAGRSVRRQQVGRKQKHAPNTQQVLDFTCVTLDEQRRIEEHPSAYKPIGPVIESQVDQGMIKPVCQLRPLCTFKQ